jgi:hypothetical protein
MRADLRSYKNFKAIVQAFMQQYALEDFTFKELDKFMWLYGRSVFAAS